METSNTITKAINTITSEESLLRIGKGILTIGGTTLEADELTLANTILLHIASEIEYDEESDDYYIDASHTACTLRATYPDKTRDTTSKDLADTKPIYEAMYTLISNKETSNMLTYRMYLCLCDAFDKFDNIYYSYNDFVNTAGPAMIGLMKKEQLLEILNLFFKRYISGSPIPDSVFITADQLDLVPPAVRNSVYMI